MFYTRTFPWVMYDVANCILADRIWCTFFITTTPSLSRISVFITLFTQQLYHHALYVYMCYLIVEETITSTKVTIFTKSSAILFSEGRVWCQNPLKLFVHLWPNRIVWRPIQGRPACPRPLRIVYWNFDSESQIVWHHASFPNLRPFRENREYRFMFLKNRFDT